MSQRLLKGHRNKPDDEMEDSLLQPKNAHRVGYGTVLSSEDEEETEIKNQNPTEATEAAGATTSAAGLDGDELDPAIIRFKTRGKSRHRKSSQSARHHESARNSFAVSNSVGDRVSHSTSKCGEGEEEKSAAVCVGLRSALIWFYAGGRKILVKYWIWMVALMLMIMSVSGKRVVVFRIFYMILFLAFLLTFQLSYRIWRRFLFPFLLTVIFYSILVLTAVFTYQFQNFPMYWQQYLMVSPKLQYDLGLERIADPWKLFIEIFTPAFFIVITIIQLLSFHGAFMDLTRDEDLTSPSLIADSSVTRRTTLPTLIEESEPQSTGTASATRPKSPIDFTIDMSPHEEGDEMRSRSPQSPSKGSQRSVAFFPDRDLDRQLDRQHSKRSTFSGDGLRPDSPTKHHRRRTIADIAPVKMENLKTAAHDIRDKAHNLWDTAKPGINHLYELFWRFLEIHMMKTVYACAFAIAVSDVTAVNFIYVIATAIAVPIARYERLVTVIFALWSATLIISKMLYQLSIASYFKTDVNCSVIHLSPFAANDTDYPPFNQPASMDYRAYLGFKEVHDVFFYILKYLIILLVLTVHSVVTLRQRVHRQRFGLVANPAGLLFMEGSRKSADKGFVGSIQFLLNYGFYKFGLELTILSMIVLIGQRMDVMGVVFSVWLFLTSLLRRKRVQCLWPFFTCFIMIMIPVQYSMSLGIPTIACIEYPWFHGSVDPELRSWLFLPDFRIAPVASFIFYDFVVLMLASRQWIVFNMESLKDPGGGSNAETYYETQDQKSLKAQREDAPDFFTFGKTILDHVKSYFFSCFYWVTLAVVFLTATGRTNLFGLGYILGCFFFLWNGSEFYLKPIRTIIKTWKLMIAYSVTVIFLKAILHLVGCMFSEELLNSNICWVSKLFGISCASKVCWTSPLQRDIMEGSLQKCRADGKPTSCDLAGTSPGILWDAICFCFLLIQKRIFGSYYFTYLVKDIKAQQVLASRGAELIHEIQAKEVMEQEEAERDVMEKIKMKMDRIRAYQQSIKVGDTGLPPDRKSHRQDEFLDDYANISPYSSADGSPLTRSPQPTDLPHTLPTVYSPTPSLPTASSPTSAASHPGKGYLEVYRVPMRHIDAASSSSPTLPSMSFASSPLEGPAASFFSSPPPYSSAAAPRFLPTEQYHPSDAIVSRPSFRLHRKPSHPMSRIHSVQRKASTHSTAASHGSVRSGDYYLFDDPNCEDADIELEEKPRRSLVPDPEGDELCRIANLRGISAFMSQLLKGELEPEKEPPLVSDEFDLDVGESSKDSAIVSVDREKEEIQDVDASMVTIITTIPTESTQKPSGSRKVSREDGEAGGSGDGSDKKSEDGQDEKGEGAGEDEKGKDGQISFWVRIIHWFTIMCWFVESCVISSTAKLNHVSRDYRYVSRRLAVEKRALKLLFEMEESGGINYDSEWKRTTLEKISRATVPRTSSSDSMKKMKRDLSAKKAEQPKADIMKRAEDTEREGEEDEDTESSTFLNSNAFVRLFRSLFYTIVSQSEIVCYTMVILNQLINASMLSLPLPIMVFLWGCMSVPRPSKTFWISLITYTEAVVVAKYIFNISVWPWIDYSEWAPKVVKGEGQNTNEEIISTHIDLALLLFLFFHRFMLKSLGLWDIDESHERVTASLEKSLEEEAKVKGISIDNITSQNKRFPRKASKKASRRNKVSTHDPVEDGITIDDPIKQIKSGSVDETVSGSSATKSTSASGDESITSAGACEERMGRMAKMSYAVRDTAVESIRPVRRFYHRLLHPPFRISHDYYSFMFAMDFFNFFIVVFAFNEFGSSTGENITKYFEDNKVPIPFLVMVMAQFLGMIIDRALYLRKNIKFRLYFHIILVIIVHTWLFFFLPSVTEKKFTELRRPKYWYVFKCVYLLLSAVQIKGGYPTRILGNTFTKKYSYFNLYLFKGYMLVPFLFDMRLIMDWIWTDTSLELDEWSVMEDIFKNLFQRKCEVAFQESFPQFRGSARQKYTKYMMGGAYLVMIVGAIWFPLVLFAVGGTVGKPNRPTDVSVDFEISGYVSIASLSATNVNFSFLNESQYELMINKYVNRKEANEFLGGYSNQDTSVVLLNGRSTPVWSISPPSREALIKDLNETNPLDLRISWKISRHKEKSQTMDMDVYKNYEIPLTNENKAALARVLSGESTEEVLIEHVFPNFLRVPEKGEAELVTQLNLGEEPMRNIRISLKTGENNSTLWFELHDTACQSAIDPYRGFYRNGKDDPSCDSLVTMLINEKVFPGALQVISGYGILGLYTTFVFVMSRLIRGLFDDVSFKVIYTQMPNVDKVLQLCLDIYLVRESREFTLEEDLFAKLLFLYRSPETLIKWTKDKEEDHFAKQNITIPAREEHNR